MLRKEEDFVDPGLVIKQGGVDNPLIQSAQQQTCEFHLLQAQTLNTATKQEIKIFFFIPGREHDIKSSRRASIKV